MSDGTVQIETDAAVAAAAHLQQVAQEVSDLLTQTRGQLTTPPALSAGGPTATAIMSKYTPQLDNLNQVLDVIATNSDAVGQTSRQVLTQLYDHDAETSARLNGLGA